MQGRHLADQVNDGPPTEKDEDGGGFESGVLAAIVVPAIIVFLCGCGWTVALCCFGWNVCHQLFCRSSKAIPPPSPAPTEQPGGYPGSLYGNPASHGGDGGQGNGAVYGAQYPPQGYGANDYNGAAAFTSAHARQPQPPQNGASAAGRPPGYAGTAAQGSSRGGAGVYGRPQPAKGDVAMMPAAAPPPHR